MKFAVWYDNGSGYYEADPCGLIEADSAEDALRVTGGPLTAWRTQRIATSGWADDPNSNVTQTRGDVRASDLIVGKIYRYRGDVLPHVDMRYVCKNDGFFGAEYNFEDAAGGRYKLSRQGLRNLRATSVVAR